MKLSNNENLRYTTSSLRSCALDQKEHFSENVEIGFHIAQDGHVTKDNLELLSLFPCHS